MILLSIAVCVIATGACSELNLDNADLPLIKTVGDCEQVGREFIKKHQESMGKLGFHLEGPNCRWVK